MPKQPRQALSARRPPDGKKSVECFCEINKNGARFENAQRLRAGSINEHRDLRIRIQFDAATTELITITDADQPCIVLGVRITEGEKLLEQDGDFLPVWRAKRIEPEQMLTDREFLLVGCAGNRPIDVCKRAAIWLRPSPNLWGYSRCDLAISASNNSSVAPIFWTMIMDPGVPIPAKLRRSSDPLREDQLCPRTR